MRKGGDEVCIFEINELIGKYQPMSNLSLKILERLQPAQLDFVPATQIEEAYLKFAQMKVTSKLSKLHFDEHLFFSYITSKSNEITLDNLLLQLANKFKLFFSVPEQIAIRNVLLPDSRNETI